MNISSVTFVVACAAGCRACTGPNNADCLACEDETLYRVTTNQPASSACITEAECASPVISVFGDRICDMAKTRPTSQGVSLKYSPRIVNVYIVVDIVLYREVLAPSDIINSCCCFCCWFIHCACKEPLDD